MNDEEELLEKLAELEHNQWAHIINYLLEQNMLTFSKSKTLEYMQLAKTPYSKLTEQQKESDREWARKTMKLVEDAFVLFPNWNFCTICDFRAKTTEEIDAHWEDKHREIVEREKNLLPNAERLWRYSTTPFSSQKENTP